MVRKKRAAFLTNSRYLPSLPRLRFTGGSVFLPQNHPHHKSFSLSTHCNSKRLLVMMNWRAIGAASALALVATFSTVCSAQDARSQQAALEKEIATLNQQIAAKQQQITALRNKPSPEQAEVGAAQKALDAARAELKATPGAENEGKVRNAEFKLKLAQLKFDKANDGIEALNDDIDRLKQQTSAKQQQIKELAGQSAEQAQAQQQKQADERLKRQQQEQELARAKQEAESAQKEIERLKAALAEKESAQAKVAAPATKASEAVAPKPAAPAQAEAPKSAAPAPAAAGGSGLIKLSSQDQVLHELQNTAQLAAQSSSRNNENESSLILYLKHPGAKTTNRDKLSMRPLGNNQYRVSVSVEPGDYEAVIGFNRWPVQFAANEAGEMTFLCDYRDKNAPRLVVYRKALEGGTP